MQTDVCRPRFASPRRVRALLAAPAAVVLAALTVCGPAAAATSTPTSTAPSLLAAGPVATSQGIIMRDGGICDPIRHMGC